MRLRQPMYLRDYTKFSYKIDSVLNEAYLSIKKMEMPQGKKVKFGIKEDNFLKDIEVKKRALREYRASIS